MTTWRARRPGRLVSGLGVAAIAAAAGSDDEAARSDLANLAAAACAVGGDVVFIVAPEYAKIKVRMPLLQFPLFMSVALADGVVCALSPAALAVELSIDVSDQAVLHMESATPLEIASTGSPATIASPVRSLWQTDTVALKFRVPANWAWRTTPSDCIAWIAAVNW